jgi:hypothetical protein
LTTTKSNSIVGAHVRILNGPCAGRIGVVVATDKSERDSTWFKVEFNPPQYIREVGTVKSCWRRTIDLEFFIESKERV